MKILIWGFGDYYRKKSNEFLKNTIIAYVSGKEKGQFNGIDIINPKDIVKYKYDRLYIMASTKILIEMLDELKRLDYHDWDKVILGWNIEPYLEEEVLLLEDGKFICDSEGTCVYNSPDCKGVIKNEKDWNKLKQKKIRCKKKNVIYSIPHKPISVFFGMERGLPVDRYYINKFLDMNSQYIKGTVLEVAGREYTLKYGSNIERSISMHVCETSGENSIIANLETGEGVIEGLVDCFVSTQTLPFIFDVKTAAENTVRFLKKGGVALVTVSGITQISRYDMDRWGHYWSFTTASLKRLFEECKDVESVEITSYGNVKSSVSGLYGLAVEDMNETDLTYHDEDYQQIIAAVVKKKN